LSLLAVQIKELPEPFGDCEPSEDYVQSRCLDDCVANYVINSCNCKEVHMPGKTVMRRKALRGKNNSDGVLPYRLGGQESVVKLPNDVSAFSAFNVMFLVISCPVSMSADVC